MREFLTGLAIILLTVPYRATGPSGSVSEDGTVEYEVREWQAQGILATTDYWTVQTYSKVFNWTPGQEGSAWPTFRILHAETYFFGDRRLRFVTLDIFRERPDELAGGGDAPAWWFTAKSLLLDVTLRLIDGPNWFRASIPPCCEVYDLGLREWGAVHLDWDEYDGWWLGRWP